VGGERGATQQAHVVQSLVGYAVQPEGRVGHAQRQQMPARGRDLASDTHQHAVVVALEGLRVEVVMVGDPDESQARGSRRERNIPWAPTAVRERGVHVHGAHGASVAVVERLTQGPFRLPQPQAQRGDPADGQKHE
jgi:hypothetical protein